MMEQDEYLEFSVKDLDKDLEYFLMARHGSPRLQEIRELTNTSLIEAIDGHFGMIGAVVRKVGDARRSQWEIDTLKDMDEVIVHEESDVRYEFFVAGEDWGEKPHNIGVEFYLKSKGKKIIQVPYNSRTSSTRIKENTIAQSHGRNYIEQTVAYH